MRSAFSTAPAARSRSSTPPALRSRWSSPTFSMRRYGRGLALRSFASRRGQATAIPKDSKAISSTSRRCASSSPALAPGTRRVSFTGRSERSGFLGRLMTKAYVLDGKAIADGVLYKVARETRALAARGVKPGLAVVLVGADPASQVYVGAKGKAAEACGFYSVQHTLSADTGEAELLALVASLNADPAVHGILVQLPLPKHVNASRVLEAVDPRKDVDGFDPINVGLLSIGEMSRAIVPCTPAGAMIMLDKACEALGEALPGKEAVVIGRSNIVGKPMAQLLLSRHCTVTIAHSRTRDLPALARRADILVAAVGQPEMVRGDWVKPDAIVIDVGVNRVAGQDLNSAGKPKTRLVGDVAYARPPRSRARSRRCRAASAR